MNKKFTALSITGFYNGLSNIFASEEKFEGFCGYCLMIKNKPVADFIGVLFLQIANITNGNNQDEMYYQLPDIFCKESYRGEQLLIDIIRKDLMTESSIIEEIKIWETK